MPAPTSISARWPSPDRADLPPGTGRRRWMIRPGFGGGGGVPRTRPFAGSALTGEAQDLGPKPVQVHGIAFVQPMGPDPGAGGTPDVVATGLHIRVGRTDPRLDNMSRVLPGEGQDRHRTGCQAHHPAHGSDDPPVEAVPGVQVPD